MGVKLTNAEDYDDRHREGFATDTAVFMQVVEMDTGITATFRGYKPNAQKRLFFVICTILTAGLLYAVSLWSIRFRLLWTMDPCSMHEAEWIYATNDEGVEDLRRVHHEFRSNGEAASYFLYRYVRFIFSFKGPDSGKYVIWDIAGMILNDSICPPHAAMSTGLSEAVMLDRRSIVGTNSYEIETKKPWRILVDNCLNPFNVFQVVAAWVWYMNAQAPYAACILIMSLYGILTTLFETLKSYRHLKEMAYFECSVNIFRDGVWTYGASSVELVPGDVFELDCDMDVLPCDAHLICGEVLLNESMLTGESIPVIRKSIPANEPLSAHFEDKSSLLYAGTRLMRVRGGRNHRRTIAMAIRTGFDTYKGFLIRQIMFPPVFKFKFYEDSYKFMYFLGCLAALGWVYTIYCSIRRKEENYFVIFLNCLDLLTVVIPPALPAILAVGTSFTIRRLRKSHISTTYPDKINICGRLDVFCFDKTGTLTEEGLDICAVVGTRIRTDDEDGCEVCNDGDDSTDSDEPKDERAEREHRAVKKESSSAAGSPDAASDASSDCEEERVFADPVTDPMDLNDKFFHLLSCCHTVTMVHGRLVGDPLDLKMFEFTGCVLEEPDHSPDDTNLAGTIIRPFEGSGNELKIIRSFPFEANLKRQSVLIRDVMEESVEFYTKGAPELIKEYCRPSSLPADFDELLGFYARHGQRVVACAYRRIDSERHEAVEEMLRLPREEIETSLTFLGFIVFENKLKDASPLAIKELAGASIRSVMVTGDNVLTAVNVARKCGIVSEDCQVFFPVSDVVGPGGECRFVNVEDSSEWLTDLPSFLMHHKPRGGKNVPNVQLALTGRVFSQLKELYSWPLFSALLARCNIYSRMSPLEKHELVEELQELDHCVAMVGDGANDCGALRVADVGVSLSESEASLAAPFCSGNPSISCAPLLVKEGRSALVTSFSSFKYMMLYMAVQFTTVCLLRWFNVNLTATQFIAFDMITVLSLGWSLTLAGPHSHLDKQRPTASLISRSVLSSILVQVLIQAGFQCGVHWTLGMQHVKAEAGDVSNNQQLFGEHIRTVLVSFSAYQYIWTAIVYGMGGKYRASMFHNWLLIFSVFSLFFFYTGMLFGVVEWILRAIDGDPRGTSKDFFCSSTYNDYYEHGTPPFQVAIRVFLLAILNFLVSLGGEVLAVPMIVRVLGEIKNALPHHKSKREELEEIGVEDLERSNLPQRPHLNKKLLKKL